MMMWSTESFSGPLVDGLVSITPDMYGLFVTANNNGQQELIIECLSAMYGTMGAILLYYKKFVKRSILKTVQSDTVMHCHHLR